MERRRPGRQAAGLPVTGFLIPFLISGWRMRAPFAGLLAFRAIGGLLIAIGLAALIECFARFALRGLGTPAPFLPAERLVATGLYRHVRNPMYLAVVAVVPGEALLFGDIRLVAYAILLFVQFHCFVVVCEEPALRRAFASEYDEFRAAVPRWIPRISPWRKSEGRSRA